MFHCVYIPLCLCSTVSLVHRYSCVQVHACMFVCAFSVYLCLCLSHSLIHSRMHTHMHARTAHTLTHTYGTHIGTHTHWRGYNGMGTQWWCIPDQRLWKQNIHVQRFVRSLISFFDKIGCMSHREIWHPCMLWARNGFSPFLLCKSLQTGQTGHFFVWYWKL